MSVLVTGATGNVGSVVVEQLVAAGLDVRAFTRSPEKATFGPGVTAVKGELLDVDALRAAMDGVDAVFLLSPVVPDELNATISALNLCREANIKAIVYLSVFQVEQTADVPHFASKFAAERMIEKFHMPVTILRPNAYMQSPVVKDSLVGQGVFPFPIGQKGVSFTDIRDIAEVAVLEFQRRLAAEEALGPEVYEVAAEDVLTGEDLRQTVERSAWPPNRIHRGRPRPIRPELAGLRPQLDGLRLQVHDEALPRERPRIDRRRTRASAPTPGPQPALLLRLRHGERQAVGRGVRLTPTAHGR